jgi:hypothetical protein
MPSSFRSPKAGPIAAAVLAVLLGGCEMNTEPPGPAQTEPVSVDLDNSEMVRVELRIGAGRLDVSGGAAKLVEGDFTYNVPAWKPSVRWTPSSFRGLLTIEQPNHSRAGFGHTEYDWRLRFNDNKPLDMFVNLGAGEANLRLGSLDLRSVQVDMGVGKLDLDLRGTTRNDYNVRIHGGVGEADVHLPADAGISAYAKGGIGGIRADGLNKDGDRYRSGNWEKAAHRIRMDIEGGIGQINLIATGS